MTLSSPKKAVEKFRRGLVERIVGDSIGYVKVNTGRTFSFVPSTIENYSGERLGDLGFHINIPVLFKLDSSGAKIERIKAVKLSAHQRKRKHKRNNKVVFEKIPKAAVVKKEDDRNLRFKAASASTNEELRFELHPGDEASGDIKVDRALRATVRRFGKLVDTRFLRAGDLLLTREAKSRDGICKLIKAIQSEGGYQRRDAQWVHAAMYLGDGSNLVEATFDHPLAGGTVKITALDEYCDGTNVLRFRRSKYVSDEKDGWRMCVRALSRLGEPYDIMQAVKLWFRVRIRGMGFYETRREATSSAVVCSTLYADSYNQATRRSLGEGSGICVPAWLSLADEFEDVSVGWQKII